MKVIKSGKNHVVQRTKCPYCNSELEYDDRDVRHDYTEYQRTGIESSSRYKLTQIVCPECLKTITLKREREDF